MTIKPVLKATTTFQCERFFRLHPHGYKNDGNTLHVLRLPDRVKVKLYGHNYKPDICSHFKPSQELNSLIILLIGDAVPVGVVADKLEEELPHMEQFAKFLREWEEHDRYASVVDPIVRKGQME